MTPETPSAAAMQYHLDRNTVATWRYYAGWAAGITCPENVAAAIRRIVEYEENELRAALAKVKGEG